MKVSRRTLLEALNGLAFSGAAAAAVPGAPSTAAAAEFTDVKELDVRPGDTLIVETPRIVGHAGLENIRKALEAFLPGVRIIVLEDGLRAAAVLKGNGA